MDGGPGISRAGEREKMKIVILSKEFPPHVYGGAGVHVDNLSRELAALDGGRHEVRILCFGEQEGTFDNRVVQGVERPSGMEYADPDLDRVMDVLSRNLKIAAAAAEADVIHAHTWYTHLAGCLLKQLTGAPLVLTTHSLEPHRPWKREQLGRGYAVSAWLEKTAYENADRVIAVSGQMKKDVRQLYDVPEDIVEVVHNGIDVNLYRRREDPAVPASYGIEPEKPYVLMVARMTRQKGIDYFLEAAEHFRPGIQVVLCAGSPDTAEYMEEVARRVERLKREGGRRIVWVDKTVPVEDLVVLYSLAAVFVCPSIYEPFGLINLEAMACGTPVVASAVGGIPEVVEQGQTGMLIGFEAVSASDAKPRDPRAFALDIADAVNRLVDTPGERREMGRKARLRVESLFTWEAVARRTMDLYPRTRQAGSRPAF